MADGNAKGLDCEANKLQAVRSAALHLLGEDVDVLFGVRLSAILQASEPEQKLTDAGRRKLELQYTQKDAAGKPVPAMNDGRPVPNQFVLDPARIFEYREQVEKLDQRTVHVAVMPRVKLSKLLKLQEEDGIPVFGWIIHQLAPVLEHDVEEGATGEPKLAENGKEPPRGRAARRRSERAETKA